MSHAPAAQAQVTWTIWAGLTGMTLNLIPLLVVNPASIVLIGYGVACFATSATAGRPRANIAWLVLLAFAIALQCRGLMHLAGHGLLPWATAAAGGAMLWLWSRHLRVAATAAGASAAVLAWPHPF